MKVFVVIYILIVCFCCVSTRKLPDYVKTCKRAEPSLQKCIKSSIESLIPNLVKGIPEMGIPPIDPLKIPGLYLDSGHGTSIGYKTDLTDLVFRGGKDMKVLEANGDFNKQLFYMKVFFPVFRVTGKYKTTGKVLLLELDSSGDMIGNFTNVEITGKWIAEKYSRKNKEYFKFDKSDVVIDIGGIQVYFKDLFKGNEELTNNTNKIFNENSDVLYNEIKPVVSAGMSALMTRALNEVHQRFSIDDLYP